MIENWHNKRLKNIGGSEIAALFGESPYTTKYKLWHIKHGLIKQDDLDDIERVQAGNYLEKAIIEWANDKWGYDFYQPNKYVEHAGIKGMACTPDAFSKTDSAIIAQVKNVDAIQFKKHWDSIDDVIIEAPLHILLQVQHEMECCQARKSILIVAVGGNRLLKMECDYDAVIGEILRKKVKEFWSMKNAPEPDFIKDQKVIRELKASTIAESKEDMSNDKKLHSLLKKAKKLKYEVNKKSDELAVIESEIFFLSDEKKEIKCKDFTVLYTKRAGTPDKIISKADLGKKIKGRKGGVSMKIISNEINL